NVTTINAFQVKDPKPMGNDALLPVEDDLKFKPTYTEDSDNWPLPKEEEPDPVLVLKTIPEVKPMTLVQELKLDIEPPKKPEKQRAEPTFVVEEPKTDTEILAEQL